LCAGCGGDLVILLLLGIVIGATIGATIGVLLMAIVASGALDTDGLTVTAELTPDVGYVIASMPNGEEVSTEVGSRTRYRELCADWCTVSGAADPDSFQVRGAEDGVVRPAGMPVQRSDYGAVLIVEDAA